MQDWKVLVVEADTLFRHGIVCALERMPRVQAIECRSSPANDAPYLSQVDAFVIGPHAACHPG